VSQACDGVSFVCVASQCADHRLDGAETDVDCGGPTCGACPVGEKFKSDFDRQDGLCSTGIRHVCY
jgi:hypothetical protein